MEFIGISGPIASGKSTLAIGLQELMTLRGHKSAVMSFAKGVKYLAGLYEYRAKEHEFTFSAIPSAHKEAYRYFNSLGYTPELSTKAADMLIEAFDRFPVKAGIKPRELLQYIGTELGRQTVDEYIWITALKREARKSYRDYSFIVIDDVRFLNETHFCDYLIRIDIDANRELYDLRVNNKLPANYIRNNHPSEQQQLRIPDYILPVDYTVSDVVALSRKIIRGLI